MHGGRVQGFPHKSRGEAQGRAVQDGQAQAEGARGRRPGRVAVSEFTTVRTMKASEARIRLDTLPLTQQYISKN